MDFTEGTEFFVDLERTFFETEERILGERFAFFADVLPFRSVFAVTILFIITGMSFFSLSHALSSLGVFCVFVPFTICLCFATYEFAYTNSRAKN